MMTLVVKYSKNYDMCALVKGTHQISNTKEESEQVTNMTQKYVVFGFNYVCVFDPKKQIHN